ncbi:MAG TPA: CBS domain-containing protein [Anaerolineaceae bacterium]|nr:CBS domain-containing protein [Anaerolineaceae bacterium]
MTYLRQLVKKPVERLLSLVRKDPPSNCISWNHVELVSRDQSSQLRVPVTQITDLHPADVAEILSGLNQLDRDQVLDQMDIKQVADALEEVEPEFQANLLEHMPDEKIADVLEEMAPDEAADLLAGMDKERSEDLLALMAGEDAADVRSLLSYPDDTAGGIMTTEYVTVHPEMTATEAIQYLRENANEAETIFYVYVTGADGRLQGVFSLKRLILADPQAPVSSFMTRRAVTVQPYIGQDEVARMISKYDLLAIPVIDPQERLLGIVTSDDALDQIIPTAWKKRLPRIFH